MNGFATYKSPVGVLKISYTDTGITQIKRMETAEGGGVPSALSDLAYSQLCEYFEGRRKCFELPLELHGTDFQMRVWRALLAIPYGETRSYKDIAQSVGCPKGFRAVGMANNKNPIAIVVPCHRVVGSDGSLVGYATGLDMKRWLLELEQNGHLAEQVHTPCQKV